MCGAHLNKCETISEFINWALGYYCLHISCLRVMWHVFRVMRVVMCLLCVCLCGYVCVSVQVRVGGRVFKHTHEQESVYLHRHIMHHLSNGSWDDFSVEVVREIYASIGQVGGLPICGQPADSRCRGQRLFHATWSAAKRRMPLEDEPDCRYLGMMLKANCNDIKPDYVILGDESIETQCQLCTEKLIKCIAENPRWARNRTYKMGQHTQNTCGSKFWKYEWATWWITPHYDSR